MDLRRTSKRNSSLIVIIEGTLRKRKARSWAAKTFYITNWVGIEVLGFEYEWLRTYSRVNRS
jgi:hypothetical protein